MPLRVDIRAYRAPFRRPVTTAHGAWTHREGLLVRLEDEAGRVAHGEVAPIPWFGTETLAEAAEWCRALGGTIEPAAIDAIPDSLPCCQFAFGSAAARLREPHPPRPIRALPVAALLPAGEAAAPELAAARERGHTTFKWKVGVLPAATELSLLQRLLDGLPPGGRLRLDANGGWDAATAEQWMPALDGAPVEYVEQPFPPGAEEDMFRLGERFAVRFALDESVTRAADLHRWLSFGWPGVYVIKPALAGSPARLARQLQDFEVDAVFSSAFTTTVGARAELEFALAQATGDRAHGFGTLAALDAPGLAAPDPGALATHGWIAALDPAAAWNSLATS